MALGKLKRFNLFFAAVLFFLNITAQEKKGFPVIGNITSEGGVTDNARATIYQDGEELQVIGIKSNGRFNLTFPFNHDYTVVISSDNCFPKKIAISTFIPKRIEENDPKFPPFVVDQSLFTEIKGINTSFSDNIILRIFYDPGINNFISEVFYNDDQIRKQIENAIWRSQQVGKTADQLAKLTDEELRLMRQEYAQWIKEAGDSYEDGQYQEALMGYKAANRLFPEEQFPIDRIAEINDLLLALQVTANLEQVQTQRFESLISEADNKFNLKEYPEAKGLYRQALNIKTNDTHATNRIKEIDLILAQQDADAQYELLISEADRLFENGDLNGAKEKFNEALKQKSDDQYPKDRLKEIKNEEDRLEKLALQQYRYEEALAEGDDFRDRQQYLRARETYDFALSFKPGDPVAIERIAQVDELMIQEKLDKDYEKSINDADKAYGRKEYNEALISYQEANSLKPDEEYPTSRISEIKLILENERLSQQEEQNYQAKISQADNSFDTRNYTTAKGLYAEALEIKPSEKYPQNRISEIEKILSEIEEQKELDDQYNALITSADGAFEQSEFIGAKNIYSSALELKSNEQYPKQRINEIDQILANLAKQQKEYDKFIAEADRLFYREEYDEARDSYVSAKTALPDEKYPGQMIAQIDSIKRARIVEQEMAQEAERAKLETDYNRAISRADSLLNENQLLDATFAYEIALEIKPDEPYPKQQIEKIDVEKSRLIQQQRDYDDAISNADRNYNRGEYPVAKDFYTLANEIKPEEQYPVVMIARVDSILNEIAIALAAEQKARDEQYTQAIVKADSLFNISEYNGAIAEYENALEIKPEEIYPKNRISEIEGILERLAQQMDEYEKLISEADRNFNREEYPSARGLYNSANEVKPEETYPEEMIAKIDSIENALALALAAEQEAIDMAYTQAITLADEKFELKDYQVAKDNYQEAANIKPEESYPKQRIDEINEIVAAIAQIEQDYKNAIEIADRAFNREEYLEAQNNYNNALTFKPDEEYPRTQLGKISEILNQLAQQEELERNYLSAISNADRLFGQEEYPKAINDYQLALTFKPGEKYPQDQIKKANEKITELELQAKEQEELDKLYNQTIIAADNAFQISDYDMAEEGYNKALDLKPGEQYPKDQLNLIVQKREEAIMSEYNLLISQADEFLNQEIYADAREHYNQAFNLLGGDEYARKKMEEIDAILNALEAAEQEKRDRDRNYSEAISLGDEAFRGQFYQNASGHYKNALEIKPDEEYPKQKISEIEDILKALEVDEEYRRVLLAADGFFRMEQYPEARGGYVDALEIKPEEQYPASQIEIIDELLNQLAEARREAEREIDEPGEDDVIIMAELPVVDANNRVMAEMLDMYNGFIDQADQAYGEEEYNIARFYYFKAVDVRPEEPYPQGRIREIRELLNARLSDRREREYQDNVDKADEALDDGELAVARGYYNRALSVKPTEKYPVMQIELIRTKLEEILGEKNTTEYNSFIDQGDKAFESGNYSIARYYYLRAQELNPSEEFPKQQIIKIQEARGN